MLNWYCIPGKGKIAIFAIRQMDSHVNLYTGLGITAAQEAGTAGMLIHTKKTHPEINKLLYTFFICRTFPNLGIPR